MAIARVPRPGVEGGVAVPAFAAIVPDRDRAGHDNCGIVVVPELRDHSSGAVREPSRYDLYWQQLAVTTSCMADQNTSEQMDAAENGNTAATSSRSTTGAPAASASAVVSGGTPSLT